MKQFVKKKVSFVMVMIMAVITVISMSLPMAVCAQGGGYTLTLKNEGSTPHTFQIYQIFSGDLDESKTLSNIQWGTGIKEASKETLGTAAEKAQTLTGESEAKEFAKTIQEHLNEDNKLEVRVEKNDSTTVANLNAGYYLIKDKEGSQTQTPPNSAYTSYILKVVGNTTAKTKLDVPELVKKVQENSKKDIEGNGWQDAADYNIDEVIPYKLTGTLPSNYAEYETYFYEFNDTMSAGLTFDKMSVKVTVDGTTLTADQDYSLIVHSDTNSFQVRFENLKAIQSVMITSTSQIVVEYKCRLNGNAVIAGNGNPNTAYLVYSNNPNQSGGGDHGKTPEDKNVVFTYKVVVNKKDEENHSLQGAQFELRKIVNDQDEGTKIDTVTVTEGTKFNFKGLDAGKYKLIETVTPSGYNTIQPIIFTIEATYDEESDDPQLTSLTGQTEGEIVFIRKTEEREDSLSTDVINKKGIQLPETGGMGRYLIYTLGTIFVLTALGYTVYKRNRKHTEK